LEYKDVVTSFLLADGRVLLLHRSTKVGTHQGRWSAVSGYLEGSEDPIQRAQTEIREEVGIASEEINLIRSGEVLRAFDEQTSTVWIIHPFLFEARSKAVKLDWENTEYKWVSPNELGSYETVPKLKETFDRVRFDLQASPVALDKVLREIDELAQDRVHGASFLGRKTIELIGAAAKASQATTAEELFSDLLLVASRLLKAQPGMAIVRNLIGKLLFGMDRRRSSASGEVFRGLVVSLTEETFARAREAAEDASRISVAILPESGQVLTHSYSRTVMRALELGMKSGRKFQVYVTESYPGLEGKKLAEDLVDIGVPVKLIADSAAASVIADTDVVLVGADSVLTDGSLVHKVGTKNIAAAAYERGIPFYSACESTKFSTADFLGEPVEISRVLFDITPSKHVSKFITETGAVRPGDVERRIRVMLREIYP
jgi:translation initiation factor 2B subunit (eIF-2B alpha/beta/delta family)